MPMAAGTIGFGTGPGAIMSVWVTCGALAGDVRVTAAGAGGDRVGLGAWVTTRAGGGACVGLACGAAGDVDGAVGGASGVGTNWPWTG